MGFPPDAAAKTPCDYGWHVATDEVLGIDSSIVDDLQWISRGFGLGEIRDVEFLATGIMNRNWRFETVAPAYALKLLCDVPPEPARRNAAVLDGLAAAGLPFCAPLRAEGGDALLSLGPRHYLVSPWAQGAFSPVPGPDLRRRRDRTGGCRRVQRPVGAARGQKKAPGRR